MGQKLRFGDKMRKLCLFKSSKGRYEKIEEDSWSHLDMEIHEHPIIDGKVGTLKSLIQHNERINKSSIKLYALLPSYCYIPLAGSTLYPHNLMASPTAPFHQNPTIYESLYYYTRRFNIPNLVKLLLSHVLFLIEGSFFHKGWVCI